MNMRVDACSSMGRRCAMRVDGETTPRALTILKLPCPNFRLFSLPISSQLDVSTTLFRNGQEKERGCAAERSGRHWKECPVCRVAKGYDDEQKISNHQAHKDIHQTCRRKQRYVRRRARIRRYSNCHRILRKSPSWLCCDCLWRCD